MTIKEYLDRLEDLIRDVLVDNPEETWNIIENRSHCIIQEMCARGGDDE